MYMYMLIQFTVQSRRLAGQEYIGFHNPTFLSERATADRNYALAWFMKENKVSFWLMTCLQMVN